MLTIEQIRQLQRAKQQFVIEVLDAVIQQGIHKMPASAGINEFFTYLSHRVYFVSSLQYNQLRKPQLYLDSMAIQHQS